MVKTDEHLAEIRETVAQIAITKSKRRKYQLHRRLSKLRKEWEVYKRYAHDDRAA